VNRPRYQALGRAGDGEDAVRSHVRTLVSKELVSDIRNS
jgi:hypothetical protein